MIFYEIRDSNHDIIASTINECAYLSLFPDGCDEDCIIKKYRNVVRNINGNTIRIIGPENHNFLKSVAIRTRTAEALMQMIFPIQKMKEEEDTRYTILSHNLTTTHAKLQGEIGSLIAEGMLEGLEYNAQLEKVSEKIRTAGLTTVAETILQLSKRVTDLGAQIEGFEMLQGTTRPELSLRNIKRVLLSFSYPFYDELNKKGVLFEIQIADDFANTHCVPIDYNFFNVAMHHFMNNIVKYTYPNSNVVVNLSQNPSRLTFKMLSIRINEKEIDRIYDLKYSGENVGDLAGEGVGMFMMKKSLEKMGASIEVVPDYESEIELADKKYTYNTFVIHLPTNS